MTKTYKFIYTFISLHLAYMVYHIFQSHKEKRMHTSLDKTSNTEFHTEHILVPVLLHLLENEKSCSSRNFNFALQL